MRIKLKEFRLKRGMNQPQLAKRSEVPQAMISNIETGKVPAPRVDTLHKLAVALKCTVDDLIEDEGEGRSA